ncbi:MAG: hypothetical protein A3C61_03870 [Candidatus Yanofskybacteria bacterium RIFCSPHIGHO2_02_FULL_39_10]|uniref:Uncharacterized protein n=1 Tax=Candidatus Yanofskybacteria bacterium RIFCSPHIGHO2_02_FULL_39_10 TaxID=1802674 RepID=A0A1F8F7F2_9BACT|nr:MAG: hypothetical protein A3C61_03870 [Candidatus Yanofskybacteria bacterium RIFCSPHIGHO2_02_FULL_39_10]
MDQQLTKIPMEKRKMYILAGVVVIAVASLLAVYFFLLRGEPANVGDNALQQTSGSAESITDSATEGVLEIDTNPMKNAPDTNPVTKTNPYSNTKTNPFE